MAMATGLHEIAKGVHVIDTYAHSVVLTEQRLVVVDASSEATAAGILDYLARARIKPTDLTSIVVTHTHPDHVGGLAALMAKAPNARVASHEIEAPYIAKEPVYDGPPGPRTQRHTPVRVDVKLQDGQTYEGLRVLHTPGHTRGSISLYDAARRLLVAGDAVRNEDGLAPMGDEVNVDPRQHRASIKRLADLDVETLVCGHGDPIPSGAGARLKALVRTL